MISLDFLSTGWALEWSCNDDSSERSPRIMCLSCKPRFKGSGGSDSVGERMAYGNKKEENDGVLLGSSIILYCFSLLTLFPSLECFQHYT